MNTKAIETLSINAVKNSIVKTDFLDEFIADNDKEPSWDGHIYVYSNEKKTKDCIKGRVPVQVKGKLVDNLSSTTIKYSISIVDLNNYLNDGGTIFFVVYISKDGNTNKIFYSELTPINIRIELKNARGQKTKSIELKEFPDDNNQKCDIFFNFLTNCEKQHSYINAELPTLAELEKNELVESIIIPITLFGNQNPNIALLEKDIYMYAQIKGSAIPQPLEMKLRNRSTIENINAIVSVNEKKFYNDYKIIRTKENTTLQFGESTTIQIGKDTINITFKNNKHLITHTKDLEFFIYVLENDCFEINGQRYIFEINEEEKKSFNIEKAKEDVAYFKKVIEMFNSLNYFEDIDAEKFSDQDWRNIFLLVKALVDKEPVSKLKEGLNFVEPIAISNMKFLLIVMLVGEDKTTYRISDFGNDFLPLVYTNKETNEHFPVSQFSLLKAEDYIAFKNIRLNNILPSFKQYKDCQVNIERANNTVLELIFAYDKSGKIDYLDVALELVNWLLSETSSDDPFMIILLLNKLQIVKRTRELSDDEKYQLNELIENSKNENAIVGAYLLLDNKLSAKKHFERLSKEEQNQFMNYPIYKFFK